jgi:autotransporter-associated beta strand protein/T5SS/PEP-CTERM-associated repeat protein
MHTRLPHAAHLPRLLTAAAALAASAPIAAIADDETWSSDQTISADTRTVSGDLVIGRADPGTVVNVSAPGQVIVTGGIYIGSKVTTDYNQRDWGVLNITGGGKVTSETLFRIGTVDSETHEAIVDVRGTGSSLSTGSLHIGHSNGASGRLDISAGGTVTATETRFSSRFGVGTLNLATGGTLATGYIYAGNSYALNLTGGAFRAIGDQTDFFRTFENLTLNATDLPAGAPALIFDTNGYDVTTSTDGTTTFTGAGGFKKTGEGILTLTGAQTYTGATTVSGIGSVLQVVTSLAGGANPTGNIVLSNNGKIVFHQTGTQKFYGVLSGTGTIAFDTQKSVVIAGAGTLRPGSGLAGTPGALTFQNASNVSFEGGATFAVFLAALTPAGNDFLLVEGGSLVLDGSKLEILRGKGSPLWGAKEGSEIVIARVTDGGKITGMFANVDPEEMSVTDASGRKLFVSVRANGESGQDLLLTMFPEPSTYALLGGAGALLLALFRRRRQRTGQRTGNAGCPMSPTARY